jgi:hypothetical protein
MYLRSGIRLVTDAKEKKRRDVPCSDDIFPIRDYEIQQVWTRFATLRITTVRLSGNLYDG